MTSVSAIVVTRDRLEQLKLAVAALLAAPIHELFVVDNSSTDGTRDWLESLDDPRLRVIRSDRNLGGAGGFALGMEHAQATDVEWLLLLDDDARPEPGAIERFLELDLDDDIGGVAAAVRDSSGTIAEMNRPGLDPFPAGPRGVMRALFGGRSALHVSDDAFDAEMTDCDTVSFVGYFVRRSLVAGELGVPRAELFIYSDDQIYSHRLRQLGHRNVLVPGIRFVHDTRSFTSGAPIVPAWRAYYLYRNNLAFYRQIAGRYFPAVLPFKLATWLLRARNQPDKRAFLSMLRLGVVDHFAGRYDRPHDEVVRRSERPDGVRAPRAPSHS